VYDNSRRKSRGAEKSVVSHFIMRAELDPRNLCRPRKVAVMSPLLPRRRRLGGDFDPVHSISLSTTAHSRLVALARNGASSGSCIHATDTVGAAAVGSVVHSRIVKALVFAPCSTCFWGEFDVTHHGRVGWVTKGESSGKSETSQVGFVARWSRHGCRQRRFRRRGNERRR